MMFFTGYIITKLKLLKGSANIKYKICLNIPYNTDVTLVSYNNFYYTLLYHSVALL